MTSTAAPASPSGSTAAAVTGELAAVLARLGELTNAAVADATVGDQEADAARIDQIALLERIQAAAAATQAALTVGFARSQVVAQQRAVSVDPRAVGRGIADQLALACQVSPSEGSRRLGIARVLYAGSPTELPATAALLRAGRVSAYVAGIVVSETRHLDAEARRAVDRQLAGGSGDGPAESELAGCAPRRAAMLARKYAYAADPEGYVQRGRTARTDRRVGLRPAPDTMALLTGFLPVEQGVACLAALRTHTDTLKNTGDLRTRDQIMADTLVERVTGQSAAADVHAEVAIVIPVDALTGLDGAEHPSGHVAEVVGHGPIPAALAKEILAGSRGRRWWRRLFTAPHGGVVGGDPTRRYFDGTLAALIGYRDGGRCREPFCDAPARHTDHIVSHRAGGPTTFTNGRATCVRSNQVREMPGWAVRLVHNGLGHEPHTVITVTPTGHSYTSRAGPAP